MRNDRLFKWRKGNPTSTSGFSFDLIINSWDFRAFLNLLGFRNGNMKTEIVCRMLESFTVDKHWIIPIRRDAIIPEIRKHCLKQNQFFLSINFFRPHLRIKDYSADANLNVVASNAKFLWRFC